MVGSDGAKGQSPAHIMVINDTPEILDLFTILLEAEGYRVTTDRFTVELGEMLHRVGDLQPDLVVLDFIIGGEQQGWQFLQLLRMDSATLPIPVVVCTAAIAVVRELEAHLDEMGVRVVLKPFDIEQVLEAIATQLHKSRADHGDPSSNKQDKPDDA